MSQLERELITGTQFDRDKIDLIKQTVAKGASDLELQLFFHACQRTGLDPLMKQIYAIKRWNAKSQREEMSIQTGIDGYRLIADRTGQYAGSSDAIYEEGEGVDIPRMAQVTVIKLVQGQPCSFTASARWDEYAQRSKDGQVTSMWKKMPYLMLAKCAEALALRKAFPAELSGVYTHEEMMQTDSGTSLEFNQTLKDKILNHERLEGPRQEDGLDVQGAPNTAEDRPTHQQGQDAPAPNELGQLMDYQADLESCVDPDSVQSVWDRIVKDASVSSDNRKSLWQTHQKVIKRLSVKRGQGARA